MKNQKRNVSIWIICVIFILLSLVRWCNYLHRSAHKAKHHNVQAIGVDYFNEVNEFDIKNKYMVIWK